VKERGKGAEEFCAIATMSDRDRHGHTERDRSWKHTHPPRDKQDDDAVHAISRGPQGGREGSWDQYTTDTIGDGIRSIPVPTQFAIERKEVQYILRIGEICLK
jgi:hypothetical protein